MLFIPHPYIIISSHLNLGQAWKSGSPPLISKWSTFWILRTFWFLVLILSPFWTLNFLGCFSKDIFWFKWVWFTICLRQKRGAGNCAWKAQMKHRGIFVLLILVLETGNKELLIRELYTNPESEKESNFPRNHFSTPKPFSLSCSKFTSKKRISYWCTIILFRDNLILWGSHIC